jgi:hypothetical protein
MCLSISCGGWKELLHTRAWSRNPGGCSIAAAASAHSDQHPSFSSCFLFFPSRSESGNDGYQQSFLQSASSLWYLATFDSAAMGESKPSTLSEPGYSSSRPTCVHGRIKDFPSHVTSLQEFLHVMDGGRKGLCDVLGLYCFGFAFWRGCLQSAFPQQHNVEGISKTFKAAIVQHSRISIPLQEFFLFAFLNLFFPREHSSVITTPLVSNKQGFPCVTEKGACKQPSVKGYASEFFGPIWSISLGLIWISCKPYILCNLSLNLPYVCPGSYLVFFYDFCCLTSVLHKMVYLVKRVDV